jgi:hypothetical protein
MRTLLFSSMSDSLTAKWGAARHPRPIEASMLLALSNVTVSLILSILETVLMEDYDKTSPKS